ncbi:MAG: DM13 domain-containing protein [Acidimicrobiales bacterium]
MGVATAVNSHRKLVIAVAAVLVAAVAAALWWFQPHKLLIDQRMDEALPGLDAPAAPAGAGDAAPADGTAPIAAGGESPVAEIVTVAQGDIRSLDHTSSGRALVVELADGSQVLRFEDLDTDNGPDLRVYLSAAPADGPDGNFDDDFVDLGALKGNVGNQNYELPSGVDLDRFQSAVIWCRRFAVGFAVAPLA